MNLESLYQILTLLFGGTSAFQFYLSWRSRSASLKKEESLAVIEQANSLEKTGAIYAYLTEITEKELSKMNQKIEQQDILIGQQKEEIKMLHDLVSDYKIKCDNCPNKAK